MPSAQPLLPICCGDDDQLMGRAGVESLQSNVQVAPQTGMWAWKLPAMDCVHDDRRAGQPGSRSAQESRFELWVCRMV